MSIKERLRSTYREARSDGLLSFLLRNTSSSFFVKVAGAGLGFGVQVALARLAALSEYGTYIYVWTWLSLLTLPSTLGFKVALVRIVSKYTEEENWGRLLGLLRRVNQYTVLVAILLGGGVAYVSLMLPGLWETTETSKMMALGMVALPFATLTIVQRGVLQGFKRVVWADAPYLVVRRVALIVFALGFWLWLGELGAKEILLSLTVALMVAYGVAQYGVIRHFPSATKNVQPVFEGQKWLRTALPFLLMSGASLVQNKADVLMIGPIAGVDQAGIYGAATRLTTLIGFGLNASNMIVAPMISEYYTRGEHEKMQRLIGVSSTGIFLYTVLAGGALLAVGSWALSLFGVKFTTGYTALVILVFGKAANALIGPVGYVMTMTGNQWIASKAFGIGMVINLILNASLIPYFGMTGAACATALSNTCWNLILLYATWSQLDINTTAFAVFQ